MRYFIFGTNRPEILVAFLFFSLPLICSKAAIGAEITGAQLIDLQGILVNKAKDPNIRDNISGIAARGDTLVLGTDEGADILVFNKTSPAVPGYQERVCIPLDGQKCGSQRKGEEIDIEGLAWGKKYLYVIGSHSRARKSIDRNKSAKKNKERLKTIKIEPTREQLFRLKPDNNGEISDKSKIKTVSLRNLFANHPVLSLFQTIPSKENGIDIEGLAVREVNGEDQLLVGFRGPVLRGNHAMVLTIEFKDGKFKQGEIKKSPKLNYLNLGGRGIRGMTEVEGSGFLLLAGPVGDAQIDSGKSRYQLFFWDGKEDDVTGVARTPLCDIPVPPGSKAEGIELLNKNKAPNEDYRFIVVYDSAPKGSPILFSCRP